MASFVIGDHQKILKAAVDEAAATLAQTPEADRSALLATLAALGWPVSPEIRR